MGALKSEKCSKGHPLAGDNLYIRKNGQRECAQCARERAMKQARKRGALPRRPPDADVDTHAGVPGYGPSHATEAKKRRELHYEPLEDA